MKRLLSLVVIITMLAGMFITTSVSAATPTYNTYNLKTSKGSPASDLASNPNGRYGDPVYTATQSGDFAIDVDQNSIKDVRFSEGDKVHITTEMMLPSGKTNIGIWTDNKVGIRLLPLFGSDAANAAVIADGIRTANRGKKDYSYGNDIIVGMDVENNRFSLFGNVNTKETWEYDKWYRFDVVLTMGANPTASIYVNGNPLTVEPPIGERTPTEDDPSTTGGRHFDNTVATFDDVHTISENVSIGYYVGDGGSSTNPEFVSDGLWGLDTAWLIRTFFSSESTLYWGDVIYRELPAGTQPELPEALTLLGVKDGGSFSPADLTAVEVQVPEFIKHKTASVELAVDGTAFSGNEGVYNLSNIGGGNKSITLTAKDASGNALRTSSMRINLPGGNDVHGLPTVTFGGADEAAAGWWGYFADLGEGFYWGSYPNNGGSEGLRAYIAPNGKDGADDYYAKLEKDDSKGHADKSVMQLGYRFNQDTNNLWNDGIVYVEYDLFLPAYDQSEWGTGWDIRFSMNMGGISSNALAMYGDDTYSSQFSFESACQNVAFGHPIKVGQWTHHKWVLDYTNHTMQLWQDGVAELNNAGSSVLDMTPGHGIYDGFAGLTFKWAGQKGDVGIDNLKVTYELAVPYIKSVDFGTGNEQGGKVLTTANTSSVEIPGMVYSTDGKTMADYVSLVDSDGNVVAGSSAAMAADGKTVNVTLPALTSGATYQIKLSENVPYGREGNSMHSNAPAESWVVKSTQDDSLYTFTAVDSFDDGEADDSLSDTIIVKDVRFTTHAYNVHEGTVAGYAGAGLIKGNKLRADMQVSNNSDSAKNIAMVIATYAGNELVNVAIGGDTVIPANAKNLTITSAPILIGEDTNLTAKVFMLDSLGNLKPLSYAYDILGNMAQ